MQRFVIALMLIAGFTNSHAQYDSSYVESYAGDLIGRFLVSRKYTQMTIANDDLDYLVQYIPNKTFSAGLGASYRFATINITVGVLRPDVAKGETRDLDLQINKYGRKFVIDFILQLYKGFYLTDRDFAPLNESYYIRPDISVRAIGGGFQYVLNHRRFSYRAAFQQTEAQKKSAGSFLLGTEIYVGRFKGDSTIIPTKALSQASPEAIDRMGFIKFGPNAGYAYTWVVKSFFVTASVSFSLNASINQSDKGSETEVSVGVSTNSFLRGAVGYNTRRWGVNLSAVSTGFYFPRFEDRDVNVTSGRYRMNVVYRFQPNKKMKKFLKGIDRIDERL